MKALLICPAERTGLAQMSETLPLPLIAVCGKPFIYYWLEHLAGKGAKEIRILASDRPEQVRKMVGDGSRWGLRVEVIPECRELTLREARKKYRRIDESDWLAEPDDIVLAEHFPNFPENNVFGRYSGFFAALQKFLPQAATVDRIGLQEIKPGVWTGLHARISPDAKLTAPCWIGENVIIGTNAIIGPGAVIENGSVIDDGVAVIRSYVGPELYAGQYTTLDNSIAVENTLINWQSNSHTTVADKFLLCPLRRWGGIEVAGNLVGRVTAALVLALTSPLALLWAIPRMFAAKHLVHISEAVLPDGRIVEHAEFADGSALWRRWPQLWNIIRGEFAWVGNRPLSQAQAAELDNDFERMWLRAPVGIVSYADALGLVGCFSDEARAHASFYTAQASWRLDFLILFYGLRRLMGSECSAPYPLTEHQDLNAAKPVLAEARPVAFHLPYSR